MSRDDLSLYSPSASITDFYEMYGEDYTEWYPHADELFELVDQIFPLGTAHNKKSSLEIAAGGLIPASESPFNFYFINKELKKFDLDIHDMYSMNKSGLRSDNFVSKHEGLHILFAGCSITFGSGMFEEYTWARKTYNLISDEAKTSGYYNIGIPGGNHTQIYNQIFKYFDLYGNPDYLFINWPDLKRQIEFGVGKSALPIVIYTLEKALEDYCLKSGIELISFSWDERCCSDFGIKDEKNPDDVMYNFADDPRSRFGNKFYRWNKDDRFAHMMKFSNENAGDKYSHYFLRAFDIVHPGIAEHDFYATVAYDIWRKVHGSLSAR